MQPTRNSRERILLFGGAGTGKSWSAMAMAQEVMKEGNNVYVIDNDFSWDRMTDELGDIGDGSMAIWDVQPDDWEAMLKALESTSGASRDDLLIIDSMTPTWQAAQAAYAERIFGKSLDQFFMDARESMKGNKIEGFDGWKDWSVINKMYDQLYRFINRFPGHVILTAEAEPISAEAPQELKDIYGAVKHRGQKSLPHKVSTILQTTKSRAGDYQLTTVKDRGREQKIRYDREEYSSFARSYLQAVAGWK